MLMKSSIVRKITVMLLMLIMIFTLNTVLSGVTNSQVSLSAHLMSRVFLPIERDMRVINESMSKIRLEIEKSSTSGTYDIEIARINEGLIALSQTTGIATERIMTTDIEESFMRYREAVEAFTHAVQIADVQMALEALIQVEEEKLNFDDVLTVSIDHETQLIEARVLRSTWIIWGMGIAFLFAATLSFRMMKRTVINPLRHANTEILSIVNDIENEKGDLTKRLNVDHTDEIGTILTSMNTFIEILQKTMRSIKHSTEAINNTSHHIKDHVGASNVEVNKLSSVLTQLSAGMEEISSTVQTIESSAKDTAELAKLIADNAQTRGASVLLMSEQAQVLYDKSVSNQSETRTISSEIQIKMMESLKNSQSVVQINELTTDILQISAQTNLLALNASIEAARAGEAGRGFAVVAEEIRALSENTKNTANDIKQISEVVVGAVEELSKNAQEMLSYLQNKVLADYSDYVTVVGGYKGDLMAITQMLSDFTDKSKIMEKASSHLSQGIEEITLAMDDNVMGVINATESITHVATTMQSIDQQGKENSSIAGLLQSEIDVFTAM